MNRIEANDMWSKIATECNLSWKLESGTVVVKKDGTVKMKFSVRGPDYEQEVNKTKLVIKEMLPNSKIVTRNYMDTYRPEVIISVTV